MGVKGLEQASNQMGIGNPALLGTQPGALQTGGAPQGAPGGWSLPPAGQQYGGPQVYVPALTTAGGGGAQPTGGAWGHAAANQPAAPGVHPWPAGPPTSAPHSWGGGGSWGGGTAPAKTPAVVFYIASTVPPPPPPYPNKALLFQENDPTVARVGKIIRGLR
jgi:hypothetical protein